MKHYAARIIAALICAVLLLGTVPFAAAAGGARTEQANGAELNAAPAVTGSHYVARGKKITLKAGEEVTWKSSDKKIATVSKTGVVKGVKAGTVKITATSKASGKKTTWKVTVMAKAVTKVTIKAPATELNLKDKKTVTLKAAASPSSAAQSFTWTSSNTKVAKVSSKGKVTAVGKGTAKITAAATDGSGRKATVIITVTAGKTRTVKIGIITMDPAESGYREKNVEDLRNTFTATNGYDAEFYSNSFDGDAQKQKFSSFIVGGVDYILLCPIDTFGWEDLLKEAKDAGIGVFLYDRMIDADPDLYMAAVVRDMKKEGDMAVKWLANQKLAEYRVVHIQGMLGSSAQIGRSAALTKKCASDSSWTLVRQEPGGYWEPSEAYEITKDVINSGEKFNVIFAENDGMADGAVQALDECGITHGVGGDVIVIGFDCNKWAMQKLLAGEWNADVQCSPFQAAPLDQMIRTLESGGKITGLNSQKQYINPEKVFDAKTITQKDIDKYGLGD